MFDKKKQNKGINHIKIVYYSKHITFNEYVLCS